MNHIDINNTVCLSKYILFLGRLSLVETSLNINFTPPSQSIIGRMAAYLGVYQFVGSFSQLKDPLLLILEYSSRYPIDKQL